MASAQKQGGFYWIDHCGVPTNNLLRWKAFYEDVMGAHLHRLYGLTTNERARHSPIRCFMSMGRYNLIGGFLQASELPAIPEHGESLPRYAYFVRPEDIDDHRKRLEEQGVAYVGPVRTSAEGRDGMALYFKDPDGTQIELWAPRQMPDGAMEQDNPVGIGRLSHTVQESRDLSRTAEFYSKYLDMSVLESADIPKDTLVMESAGVARLVFKEVKDIGPRTGSHVKFDGQHLALAVREEEFLTMYGRIWDALPGSDYVPGQPPPDESILPPRTQHHATVIRGESPDPYGHGIYFYDWDCSVYHFVGAQPVNGAMIHYEVTIDAGVPARPTG